jgi:hypothetical protein
VPLDRRDSDVRCIDRLPEAVSNHHLLTRKLDKNGIWADRRSVSPKQVCTGQEKRRRERYDGAIPLGFAP